MPTLNATIKNLDNQRIEKLVLGKLEDASALQLGIEALKREQERRREDLFRPYDFLPGETED